MFRFLESSLLRQQQHILGSSINNKLSKKLYLGSIKNQKEEQFAPTSYEYTIKPPGKFSLNLKELWLYRDLIYFFAWRDIKVKYKQTLLGFLWAILQPVLMMGIFVIFFAKALKIQTDHIPAPIFYYSSLLLWNLFSSGLSSAANSMVDNANIIKKIYFPRLIIPIASILVAFFDFVMAFLVFILLLIYYELADPLFSVNYLRWIGQFVIGIFICLIFTMGLGMLLAAWNVKYRDFRYVVPFLLYVLLFLTPVIYPVSIFENWTFVKYLLAANPLTGAIDLARSPFNQIPIDKTLLSLSIFSSLFLFCFGIFSFRKMEAYFADLA